MIRVQSIGPLAYGGVVTLAEWYDTKRINEGKLTNKDVLKKAGFYAYLAIGLVATLSTTFGWMRRYDGWFEPISNGFLYDVPRFAYNLSKALGTTGGSVRSNSQAIAQAQRLAQQQRALGAGLPANRTYQPEFEPAGASAI